MAGSSEPPSTESPDESPVLECVRRAVSHDLGTPLSTIANYAAVLESPGRIKPEDVRVFAGRIRSIAMRTAITLRQIVDAMALSERAPRAPSELDVDASGLVRVLLSELTLHVRFPARGREPTDRIPFDPDLLAFAWRAFLAVNAEAAASGALDLDIEVQPGQSGIAVEMSIGSPPATSPTRMGASKFSEECADVVPRESFFALELAEELIRRRGGEFSLWGRPGVGAGLRIGFPRAR